MNTPKKSPADSLEHKYVDLRELKSLDEGSGGFEGIANSFGSLDSYNDITVPGCFQESLADFIQQGWSAPDHEWGVKSEIGIIVEARETDEGLYVRVEFHPTDDAQNVRKKIKNRIEKGKSVRLSIGYSTEDERIISGRDAVQYLRANHTMDERAACVAASRVRLLLKVKLYEVSPVSVPAEPNARVTAVKGAFSDSVEGAKHKGLMVGCFLSDEAAKALALEGGEAPEDLHLTLAYCGDVSALDDMTVAQAMVAVKGVAGWNLPLNGKISGLGRFNSSNTTDGKDVVYASVDMPGLSELQNWIAYVLRSAGVPPRDDHGFNPHITLAYVEQGSPSPVEKVETMALRFDSLVIVIGEERTVVPLSGYSNCYSYLGTPEEAETKSQELLTAEHGSLAGLSFADHSETVLAAAEGLVAQAKSINGLRAKEGRTISAATRDRMLSAQERIKETREAMDQVHDDLGELCALAEKPKTASVSEKLKLQLEFEAITGDVLD
jgi:HK97 family phage prohead protease